MIKYVVLLLVIVQLSQVEGRWWRRFRPRPRPAPVCDEWCFSSTSCMLPGNNTCTRCLADACDYSFGDLFSTHFGLSCINRETYGSGGSCQAECPDWTSSRSQTCKDCLKPCIKIANKNSDLHCPNSGWWDDNNHCSACVSNTTCPTKAELFENAPDFCCDYVEISCGDYPGELLDDDLNPWNVSCVRDAYGSDCSKCPSFDNNRWTDCSDCLDTCKERVTCALGCGARTNYPVGEITCPYCKALCAANSNAADDCVATNCPDCATCNDCHSTCESEGYIDNNCECVERNYFWRW